MEKPRKYATAAAFRRALEDRLRLIAGKEGLSIERLRREVAFDRFLARLFAGEDAPWVLKGGYALELRIKEARVTKDIDMALRGSMGKDKPLNEAMFAFLEKAAEVDLADFFVYVIGRAQMTSLAVMGILAFSAAAQPGARWLLPPQAEAGADGLPEGWKQLAFKKVPRRTVYTLEKSDEDGAYVRAVSSASASAIVYEIGRGLAGRPVLKWSWKVERLPGPRDPRVRAGDDYPARVYVAFRYDPAKASLWDRLKYAAAKKIYGRYPPAGAIDYVWDTGLPVGSAYDNPYTARAKMLVLESGPERTGRWVEESRDVLEDYRRLFGAEPPELDSIALMSDTDDTKDRAAACFRRIAFLPGDS